MTKEKWIGILFGFAFFISMYFAFKQVGQKDKAWREHTDGSSWTVKMDCGQRVTATINFEGWLLKNQDKKIVSVTSTDHSGVFYVVYEQKAEKENQ